MDNLIANFTTQIKEALQIGREAQLNKPEIEIKNVLVSGLGGSGIGGNLVQQIVSENIKIPYNVNKEYSLPAYISENSLVIISSYSGNTEETLSAFTKALNANAKIVCVSSGGRVIEIAKEKRLDHILIPGGMPPRTCLAYSFIQQLFILKRYGLIDIDFESQLENTITLLDENENDIKVQANEISNKICEMHPMIYVCSDMETVAVRFRQQLNENSKMLACHHVIPEMNHNELVGWRSKDDSIAVILFRNENDFDRNQQRIEICKEIFSEYTNTIIELWSKGNSFIERAIYLIHLGDWISYYNAINRQVDAIEVNVIDRLKGELAKSEVVLEQPATEA
ncbi:MAG: bifunctional phosphoglucose/phosphomannose isomerase [Bacteroidetes bacterium]|nr:bifunctional phosphoglucose/phosphomannose isomerase [Bacteroidia bacterium]PCH67428.1 MAG: bifunctional phosphoglucose/phosphomannose isomerase [Bacteroidota bacterium]